MQSMLWYKLKPRLPPTRLKLRIFFCNIGVNYGPQQKWSEHDRKLKADEVIGILKPMLHNYKPTAGRPERQLFGQKLGKISGCAGPDGWAKAELKIIAENEICTKLIWDNMQLWELFEKIPTAVYHCKLVHIPKKKKRHLPPSQYRSICVLSCWWRAWSMSTVDLELMEKIMSKCLPTTCHIWSKLLIKQWRTMKRWIIYDAEADPRPVISQQGLPQGDPAAALLMTTLSFALVKMAT